MAHADTVIELIPNNVSVRLYPNEDEISLTRLEYQLMNLLYENPSKGITYEEIYEEVWQTPYKDNKYRVANLVFHLREKLEKAGGKPSIIRTVRSRGYMLDI